MPVPVGNFVNVAGTPAAPKFARLTINSVTVEGNLSSKPHVNIFDFYAPTAAGGGTEATLGSNLWGGIQTAYLDMFTVNLTVQNYNIRFMDNLLNLGTVVALSLPGTSSDDNLPSFNARVIRKVTNLSSRNYRGASHFGNVPESSATKDDQSAAGLVESGALRAGFIAWQAGVSDGVNSFVPVVISPTLSNLNVNPRIFTGAYIQDFVINDKLGTMKRRKEKG